MYPVDRQNPDSDSGVIGGDGNEIDLDKTNGDSGTGKPTSSIETNSNPSGNEVFIMDNRNEDRTASFFAQPGILAGKYFLILNLTIAFLGSTNQKHLQIEKKAMKTYD